MGQTPAFPLAQVVEPLHDLAAQPVDVLAPVDVVLTRLQALQETLTVHVDVLHCFERSLAETRPHQRHHGLKREDIRKVGGLPGAVGAGKRTER